MWTRREGINLAITALAAAWTNSTAQAQAPATASTLAPTGKLRAALIVSNPVLVTRRPDGTLGGVSLAVANALAVHLGVPIQLKPYDNPARYNDSLRSRPMTGTLASLPAIPRALTISHSAPHLWRSTTATLHVLMLH